MKKYLYLPLLIIIGILILASCSSTTPSDDKLKVVVSIVPQEGFVKKIAGDLVEVQVLIPPGSNPATYQPTPKQMTAFNDASIYFTIDVPTESAFIRPNMGDAAKDIKIVDIADIVDETYPPRFFSGEAESEVEADDDHSHEGRDPHIWMSPKRTKLLVEVICSELVKIDPANKDTYETNLANYIEELSQLDEDIITTISKLENKSFIIMHPSLGYFADDYGLNMVAIEQDGKETTAKRLQSVIDYAKDNQINVIFYQAEFDSQQAQTLALEIDGTTLEIEPLAKDYLDNMQTIIDAFKNGK